MSSLVQKWGAWLSCALHRANAKALQDKDVAPGALDVLGEMGRGHHKHACSPMPFFGSGCFYG